MYEKFHDAYSRSANCVTVYAAEDDQNGNRIWFHLGGSTYRVRIADKITTDI